MLKNENSSQIEQQQIFKPLEAKKILLGGFSIKNKENKICLKGKKMSKSN